MTTRVRAEMPEAEPTGRREGGWWIPAVGFVVIAAAMFMWGWTTALNPNGYWIDAARVATPGLVTDFARAIALEVAIVALVFAVRGRISTGVRSILLSVAMLMFMVALVSTSAPGPQFIALQFAGALWLLMYGFMLVPPGRIR